MDDFKKKPVNRLEQQNPFATSPAAQRPAMPATPQPLTLPAAPAPQAPTPVDVGTQPLGQILEQEPVIQPEAQPSAPQQAEPTPVVPKKPKRKKRIALLIIGIVLGLVLLSLGGAWLWFQMQLAPVDSGDKNKVLISVKSGDGPVVIASTLKENNLIKSEDAFLWYTRIYGTQGNLQAGTYRLSPSESTQQIVQHLTKGTVDTFDITFLPGSTLKENRKVFIDAGYSEQEVDAAFIATYDSPLFKDKPVSADLEGYIYGDTYKFGAGATVKSILEYIFDNFYTVIEKNDLIASFETHNLNLYQGITLASIIQRESIGGDEAQIAQVFYSRIAQSMPLGSDVTYQYIADKTGVDRDPNLDSPYNTRRYAGLPPGPIATAGIASLKAVATPAMGSYLYFLSGDDNVTYFATTLQGHEANIANHCKKKCQII